jgi:ribosome-associated protein
VPALYSPEVHSEQKLASKKRRSAAKSTEEPTLEPLEVAQFIVDIASDKLAEDIVLLDLRGLAPFADYFVIMSAESSRQIEALEQDLTQTLKDARVVRHRREGAAASGWVLLDFSNVIVHVFSPEEREFYDLERLWSRAPQVVRVL